jgi:hypothetical protein
MQLVFINHLLQPAVGPDASIIPAARLPDVHKDKFQICVTAGQQHKAKCAFVVVVDGCGIGKTLHDAVLSVDGTYWKDS